MKMNADTDLLRLQELTLQHGLTYKKHGANGYAFDDRTGPDAFSDGSIFIALGLSEALAFAEGFDRAREQIKAIRVADS